MLAFAKRNLRANERGDTIVEVLIAIAVSSLILTGAYVTTNNSLSASRDAQEHTAGVKLVEAQIEKVRYAAVNNASQLFGAQASLPFCITGTSTIVAATSSSCSMGADGGAATGQPTYKLSITRTNTNTFTVTNTWPAVSGDGNDQIVMIYRAYQ